MPLLAKRHFNGTVSRDGIVVRSFYEVHDYTTFAGTVWFVANDIVHILRPEVQNARAVVRQVSVDCKRRWNQLLGPHLKHIKRCFTPNMMFVNVNGLWELFNILPSERYASWFETIVVVQENVHKNVLAKRRNKALPHHHQCSTVSDLALQLDKIRYLWNEEGERSMAMPALKQIW